MMKTKWNKSLCGDFHVQKAWGEQSESLFTSFLLATPQASLPRAYLLSTFLTHSWVTGRAGNIQFQFQSLKKVCEYFENQYILTQ